MSKGAQAKWIDIISSMKWRDSYPLLLIAASSASLFLDRPARPSNLAIFSFTVDASVLFMVFLE
jgi:hypothetical protein